MSTKFLWKKIVAILPLLSTSCFISFITQCFFAVRCYCLLLFYVRIVLCARLWIWLLVISFFPFFSFRFHFTSIFYKAWAFRRLDKKLTIRIMELEIFQIFRITKSRFDSLTFSLEIFKKCISKSRFREHFPYNILCMCAHITLYGGLKIQIYRILLDAWSGENCMCSNRITYFVFFCCYFFFILWIVVSLETGENTNGKKK